MGLLLTSCSSYQEAIRELPETRIRISDDINITKDGMSIGNMNIMPTQFRHRNVVGVQVPDYYGVTITIKY